MSQVHSNIHVLQLEVTNFESYPDIVQQVGDVVKDEGLNVLFNNAGFAPKSTRLPFVKSDELLTTIQVNTIAPIMMTKAFVPLLKKASQVNAEKAIGVERAGIINMSSLLGSIASNREGGMYAYRVSKSGLNAATKSISIDLRDQKIFCVSLHPGWVRTDMGGSHAPMDVESSCAGILDTIHGLNDSHNGGFVQWDGTNMPW